MTQALRQTDEFSRSAATPHAARVGAWAGIDLTGGGASASTRGPSATACNRAMARLLHGRGLDLVAEAAPEQGVVIDPRGLSLTARAAVAALQRVGLRVRLIPASTNGVDHEALVVDTAGLGGRGLDESGARQLGSAIADRLCRPDDEAVALRVKRQVRAVADRLALVEAAGRGR